MGLVIVHILEFTAFAKRLPAGIFEENTPPPDVHRVSDELNS
jgi:hypothetical protein